MGQTKESGASPPEQPPRVESPAEFLSRDFLTILTDGGIINPGGDKYYPYVNCDFSKLPQPIQNIVDENGIAAARPNEVKRSIEEGLPKYNPMTWIVIKPGAIARLTYEERPRSIIPGMKNAEGTTVFRIKKHSLLKISAEPNLTSLFMNRARNLLELRGIDPNDYLPSRGNINSLLRELADNHGAGKDIALEESQKALHEKIVKLREEYGSED